MEMISWSLCYDDSERGTIELLQGVITRQKLPGFLLAVSRLRGFLSGLSVYCNGRKIDHLEFNASHAIVRAEGGGP
jgi:hypothetical protein